MLKCIINGYRDTLGGAFVNILSKGFDVDCYENTVSLSSRNIPNGYGRVETAPYPLFPTDMQSLLLTLAACSRGQTIVVENLFENRLEHNASELNKMGADITVKNNAATVIGKRLHSSTVAASDLRGGAGLVIAALAADGESTVGGIEHVNRGYVDLAGSLNKLGADITEKN